MMAQREEAKVDEAEPEFITYLLDSNVVHDVYFLVGNKKKKIGAVRKMLAAHSTVLRSELEDSLIAEKGDIYLDDVSPDTFKNLLRFVYGYNKISILNFDEADDLLYAANKYLIKNLKDQVAVRLLDLLDSRNVCSLLNNPACYTVLELDAKITEILQYETDAVFERPEFVNIRVEGFIKMLEQSALCATELEIFKTALKWAKHQGQSEDGPILRNYISKLKHIRIRTLAFEDIYKEIVPTNILTDREVVEICTSHGKGEIPPIVVGFSDKTDSRFQLQHEDFAVGRIEFTIYTVEEPEELRHDLYRDRSNQSSFTIKPTHDLILLPFEFDSNDPQASLTDYHCDCIIEVTRVSSPPNSALDRKVTVKFNEKVKCGEKFKVPLPANCKKLLANNSYTFTITFSAPHFHYTCEQSQSCTSLSLECNTRLYDCYLLPFNTLKYIKCL